MTGRKTIISSFFIVLAGCFLLTFMVFAEDDQQIEMADEGQQITEEYAPGFYYTVKKGDTLWDLSRKFYDSEWQWPALWGQNKTLTNPHLIYPNQRIRLYQRTDAITHTDTTEAGDAATEEQVSSPAPLPEAVYYLHPGIAYVGFIQKLPETGGLFDESFDDPLAMGVILKAAGEKKDMISQDDTVYIKPASSKETDTTFIVGDRYSIYAPLTKINDPVTGDYAGHQYKIIGAVEVTATAAEYISAKVIKSLDSIKAGCFVMPFERRDKEIAIQPSPAGLAGEILIAEDHIEMSSDYSIIFINKGEKDGVQVGQRYDVYYQDKGEIDGKEVLLSQFVFGELLVLLTKETTATAIVTKSKKPIRRGDAFRSAL